MVYGTIILNINLFLLIFWSQTNFWVRHEMGGGVNLVLLVFMGFSMVYESTLLSEHPFLVILGPGTDFWAGQEVTGAGHFFTF